MGGSNMLFDALSGPGPPARPDGDGGHIGYYLKTRKAVRSGYSIANLNIK